MNLWGGVQEVFGTCFYIRNACLAQLIGSGSVLLKRKAGGDSGQKCGAQPTERVRFASLNMCENHNRKQNFAR